jgi:hypothetical protein
VDTCRTWGTLETGIIVSGVAVKDMYRVGNSNWTRVQGNGDFV